MSEQGANKLEQPNLEPASEVVRPRPEDTIGFKVSEEHRQNADLSQAFFSLAEIEFETSTPDVATIVKADMGMALKLALVTYVNEHKPPLSPDDVERVSQLIKGTVTEGTNVVWLERVFPGVKNEIVDRFKHRFGSKK